MYIYDDGYDDDDDDENEDDGKKIYTGYILLAEKESFQTKEQEN